MYENCTKSLTVSRKTPLKPFKNIVLFSNYRRLYTGKLFFKCRRIQFNWGSCVDVFPLSPWLSPVLPLRPVLRLGATFPLLRDRDRRPGGKIRDQSEASVESWWPIRWQRTFEPTSVLRMRIARWKLVSRDQFFQLTGVASFLYIISSDFNRLTFLPKTHSLSFFSENPKTQNGNMFQKIQGSIIREKINDVSQLLDGPLSGNAVTFITIFSQMTFVTFEESAGGHWGWWQSPGRLVCGLHHWGRCDQLHGRDVKSEEGFRKL